ncbi:hypothetical protein ACVV2G_04875 [Streptomyces ziwulingensis]
MTVDPTDPETFDTEARNSEEGSVEAPEADAAEQQAVVAPEHDDPPTDIEPGRANEADLAEQARIVSHDEDDYR